MNRVLLKCSALNLGLSQILRINHLVFSLANHNLYPITYIITGDLLWHKTCLNSVEISINKEEQMEKCADCVFFLPHKRDGFNCGFLIKKVDKNSGGCGHFQSINKDKATTAASE